MQIWARIEALHCRNMQKARELWDVIMTRGNAKFANMWLEYYNLERAYGDAAHCRKALHRAVQCTSDYPEHVCEVLLSFERVEGSLEDWDTAVQKTETRLNRVTEQRAKVAVKEASQARQEEEKVDQRRRARAEKKSQKKGSKPPGRPGEKRKAQEDFQDWGDEPEKGAKRHRQGGAGEGAAEEYMETESKAPPRRKPEGTNQSQAGAAGSRKNSQEEPEERRDDCSVFVSNLAYTLPEPEAKLREHFHPCGPISQVRLVFAGNGTFRGYGYVQFEGRASVAEALKLDRTSVNGRPMFVSPCVDKSKNPDFKVFKYSLNLERHKIFISGLPYSCSKEQLEDMCRGYGTIKDIRLVTHRSGQPKGLAYVEFANEAEASQAVLKMDGLELEEHKLAVAISNPPRRSRNLDLPGPSRTLVPRQAYGARGKGRTQLSLLPRSLHRQTGPAGKAENGTTAPPDGGVVNSAGEARSEAPSKPLSNSDFARMLMTKK